MLYNIIYSLPHPFSLREMPGDDGYTNEESRHHLPSFLSLKRENAWR